MVPAFVNKLAKGYSLCVLSRCGRQLGPSGGGSSTVMYVQPLGKDKEVGGKPES